jgi:peptide/nickel transport system permease protein
MLMTDMTATCDTSSEGSPRISRSQDFIRVFSGRKVAVFGAAIILALIVVAIFAPLLAPYDPYQQNLREALQPPSKDHLLGTDPFGRDTLSRIIYGTRPSLAVGLVSVGIGALLGMSIGLLGGYFGGIVDTLTMRAIDALMFIPTLILALAIGAALGGGLGNVMISLGIALTPTYARLMRCEVLTVKQSEYVTAGRAIGCRHVRIMLGHVLPNTLPPLIVLITLNLGTAILAEAALSFLGLGISPPGAAWGAMVNDGYRFLLSNPILSFAPGLCIMLVVLAFNLAGDGVRDALDPRLRGVI